MSSPAAPIPDDVPHVLVVDDDNRLRDLLKKFLSDNGYRVTTAEDAAQAGQRMAGLAFDLVVLDVMMPGQSGLEFTAELRKTSDVPILMLTARGESDDRIAGLELGVDDYLPKPFEPRELLLRVKSILKRTRVAEAPAEVHFGSFVFHTGSGVLLQDDEPVKLTSSETALLQTLARTPNETVSRDTLRQSTGASEGRAMDVQITRLRRKIEDNPKEPRYLHTVWGSGYVLRTD
jgi:two-component system phosphate regulon response regulator OmpR